MKALFVALLTIGALAGCARHDRLAMGSPGNGAQTLAGSATVAAEDARFARQACQTGAAEMEIGKLAERNTRNKAVRSFAGKLSEDHAKAERELSQLFSRKGIPPESELANDLQSSLDNLAGLKGGEFDAAFKQQVISDHEKTIALYQKQAEHGTDPDLKAFAQKHLPHLREHLEMARALPVSTDTEGPPADSINSVLQHPSNRINIPR